MRRRVTDGGARPTSRKVRMPFRILSLAFERRMAPLTLSVLGFIVVLFAFAASHSGLHLLLLLLFGTLVTVGVYDLAQARHSVLRNYPISAHLRFILERVRPEIRQYFFEDETHGYPFSRETRSVIYQRAKNSVDNLPFGTQLNVYGEGFEWLAHSMTPKQHVDSNFRLQVGGPACAQPYQMSIFNISAMSFGSLSANAILALNAGAKKGGFAHDTGEGGYTPYHRRHGGDLIWEIGSGYFGCRTLDGAFDPDAFASVARNEQIKMIEIKLSQGAKPGHGGILPGAKVTPEIAAIRGVRVGVDCVSPAAHSAFHTPVELMQFIARLRELSLGKPIGFKLCIGQPADFLSLCKAMLETGIYPDFIVIDGKEGGTGAAPLEFMDHLGMPMRDGLTLAHHALIGIGAREHVRLGASGKIATAFDIARAMSLGADWCNSARGFMFALGCIQSLKCHTDRCPTGVATQDRVRARALVPSDKSERVYNYHRSTMLALGELVASAGLEHPRDFGPAHFYRRVSEVSVASFAELWPPPVRGSFIEGHADARYSAAWAEARAHRFGRDAGEPTIERLLKT
jgi:glutamate synthase domain-containing protein 2